MDGFIERSATARGVVARTAASLDACRISPSSAAVQFAGAGRQRTQLATEAEALPTTQVQAVPGGPGLVAAFGRLQRLSAQADQSFAAWAQDVAGAGCAGTAPHTANWATGNTLSGEATSAKRAFIALWNPLAAQQGMQARNESQI
jgi:hypothetical protein